MSVILLPIVELYRNVLNPMQPFSSWLGTPISMLDIGAAFRLCMILRQIREQLHAKHIEAVAKSGEVATTKIEPRSFVRDAATTLLVVYGGEAVTAPYLGIPPSFMVSGVVPLLYIGMQATVENLASVPPLTLNSELPLAFLDGLTRAYLLCNLIPPAVVTNASTAISTSPWTLLLTSLITANTGFFLVNMFSFLQPHALSLTTPAELLPWGWTTADLWCAPLITGLYALLTHAQPYWADLHVALLGWLGQAAVDADGLVKVAPVDPEYARAICAVILAALFTTRTVKNFSGQTAQVAQKKVKTQ